MNAFRVLGVLICSVLMMTGPAAADPFKNSVSVSGNAVIQVVPDQMTWTLKINNKGPEIKALAARHTEVVSNVLAFLNQAGIDTEKTQTSSMRFGESVTYDRQSQPVREGYFAASMIHFELLDFVKYQHLWEGLSGFAGVSVQNVGYGFSKSIDIKNKARVMALKAAKKKARDMAQTLGMEILAPIYIEDLSFHNDVVVAERMMANAPAGFGKGAGAVALGKIKIESRVKVIFGLLPD